MTAARRTFAGKVLRATLTCQVCPATVTVYGHDVGHARDRAEAKGWRADRGRDGDYCPVHALNCPVMNLPPLPPGATGWKVY